MKHRFVVSQLVSAPQKYPFALIAFLLDYGILRSICHIDLYNLHVGEVVVFCLIFPLFTLVSFIILLGYNGMEVDMVKRTWKQYYGLLGLSYGKSEPLPASMDYILVFEPVKTDISRMEGGIYEVAVVYGPHKQVFLLSGSRNQALNRAEKLSEIFGLRIENRIMDMQP
jgi:hypothetical protein